MTQGKRFRFRKPSGNEVRRYYLSKHSAAPEELFGSKMDREAYLDSLIPELLTRKSMPQARA